MATPKRTPWREDRQVTAAEFAGINGGFAWDEPDAPVIPNIKRKEDN